MVKLAAAEPQGEWGATGAEPAASAPASEADTAAAGMVARVRLMMIISGLTTLIAIAAVVGVVSYRVYHSGGAAAADAIVTLPKGAHVTAAGVAGDRIVVTVEAGGATEIRTFDAKTLKETGRLRFANEP
jgi:hypothetical protein